MITPSTQRVRAGHHQRDVLAGARLGLVGVDDEVLRLRVVLRDEAPLHAGREARAATAAQAGVLDRVDDRVGRHPERLVERAVAAVRLVGRERPGALGVPVVGEDRGQGAHLGSHLRLLLLRLGLGARRCRPASTAASLAVGTSRRSEPSASEDGAVQPLLAGDAGGRPARPDRRRGPRRRGRRGSRRAPARPRARCRSAGRGWRGPRCRRAGRRPAATADSGVMLSMNSQLTIITGA